MTTGSLPGRKRRAHSVLATALGSRTAALPTDFALVITRIVLAWIFIYYGAGKLFGAFNGPGMHATALYFSNTAHLHPGGLFAVLGGVVEFGGGIAVALGLGTRLAGVALFGDMVIAMITVTWATGINSQTSPPGYQLNLALGVLALVLAFFGGGRFSVDAFAERRIMAVRRSETSGAAGTPVNHESEDGTPPPAGSPRIGVLPERR